MPRRRIGRRNPYIKFIFIGIVLLLIVSLIFVTFSQSREKTIKNCVNTFYQYEKGGDFGSSWKLFHPFMKEKFSQEDYIQKRGHIFMQDFGVKTFDYTVGKPKHLKSWKFLKSKLKDVYKVPITQSFKSQFGNFIIEQDVYVVKVEDEWTILWSYEK